MSEPTDETSTPSETETAPKPDKKARSAMSEADTESTPTPVGQLPPVTYDLDAHARLRARLKAKYRIGGRG